MLIRRAGVDDVAGLAASLRAVAGERRFVGVEASRTQQELEERFARKLSDGHHVFLLESDRGIEGSADVYPTVARRVWELGIFINASVRGGGWGRRLLHTAVDAARDADARKLILEVWQDNGRALGLYADTGWVVEGVRRDHWEREDGEIRSSVLMALFL